MFVVRVSLLGIERERERVLNINFALISTTITVYNNLSVNREKFARLLN